MNDLSSNLFARAHACLAATDPDEKCALASALWEDWQAGRLSADADGAPPPDLTEAGRPQRPELVSPRELPRRRLGSTEGRAAAIHAFTHIEFNAINLACDAVYRFHGLPDGFYTDWLRVAAEEAYHFGLLRQRLRDLGYDYGDFPAHNGLWELAMRTAGDPLLRMALVPRVMEARGLDVTPGIQKRFREVGDADTAAALDVILRDEVGHVQAGSRWFHHLCEQRGLEAEATYFALLQEHMNSDIRCPLHKQARREAGFSEHELQRLEALCDASRTSSS